MFGKRKIRFENHLILIIIKYNTDSFIEIKIHQYCHVHY